MIAALLAGLVAAGPPPPEDARAQSVRLDWDAQTRACVAVANGIPLGDPGTEAGRTALLRALPDHGRRVQLRGIEAAPYACADTVVSLLRDEGYAGVTMGSLSPPARR